MTRADHSMRFDFPFLTGALLAVNAIRDAHLLIDGPDCLLERFAEVFGRHDLESTLMKDGVCRRAWFTDIKTEDVAGGTEARFTAALTRIAGLPGAARVLATAMPMCTVTGTQYDRLLRGLPPRVRALASWVPPPPLGTGWLPGYDKTLEALAASMPLRRRSARAPRAVAVVGLLTHRLEGDAAADALEIRRLLEGLGLEVKCLWPSGSDCKTLARAADASVILSLPYARDTARTLARRLDCKLLETELPFGFAATRRWLKGLGAAFGVERAADRLIDEGLRETVPRLKWAVQGHLTGRRVAYAGDPHLLPGLAEMLAETGASLVLAALADQRPVAAPAAASDARLLSAPPESALRACLADLRASGGLDLLIANSEACALAEPETPLLEFGFPSYYSHAFTPTPSLGMRGAAAFLDRVVRALTQEQLRRLRRAPTPCVNPG